MCWKVFTLGALLLIAATELANAGAASVRAATAQPVKSALRAAEVPADAKWIIYMNIDQAMANPAAGKMLSAFMRTHPRAKKNMTNLEIAMGADFPRDFHDVLLFGRHIGPNHGVVVIHAHARQSQIARFLKANRGKITVTTPVPGMIKVVNKKGQTIYETSPRPGTFVMSRTEKSLRHELHVLAAKSGGMAPDNPLLVGARPGVLMYMADMNMAQLANRPGRHHGPIWMKSVTGAWLAVRVKKERLNIRARIDLIDADSAAQMVQMAQGWQAMMDLGATSANVKPRQRFIAGIADRLNVGAIGKVVAIHWSMSLPKLLAGPEKQSHPAP